MLKQARCNSITKPAFTIYFSYFSLTLLHSLPLFFPVTFPLRFCFSNVSYLFYDRMQRRKNAESLNIFVTPHKSVYFAIVSKLSVWLWQDKWGYQSTKLTERTLVLCPTCHDICEMIKGNESHVGNVQFWVVNIIYLSI